ncbi:MAG: tetratricopeptide repeat protein [Ignavibacteriales bacterium]|nr:tetratricopeptide repeat protein [Ignavibacteriales bacterium]
MLKFFSLVILITFFPQIYSQTISQKFDDAMVAYHNQQYAQSNRLFEEFFNEYKIVDEVFATAKYYSAESLLKLGRKDEAAIGLEYLTKTYNWSNYRDKALYNLGLIYYNSSKYELARKRFKLLLTDYPESDFYGNCLYWVGESFSAENKPKEAIQFLEEAVADKRNKKYADYTLYTLANAYEKVGDYNNAVKYYDQLLTYHKNSTLATSSQIRIGICYFKLKDYQSSIVELKSPRLTNLSDDMYSESIYLLATSYYRVGEYGDAEKSYLEVLQKFPDVKNTREAKYGLAWTYFQQKKYDEAFISFDELSNESDSLGVKSLYWKGECKRYLGKNDEASAIYKEFLEQYPNDPLVQEVQYQLGVVYFNINNTDLATRYLISANASDDDVIKGKSFAMLGEIELNKGNFKSAKNYFDIALANKGAEKDVHNRALLGLGISLFHLNDNKSALKYLNELESADPGFESQKLNFFLAENYFTAGNFKTAINNYQSVSGSDQEINSQALYGLAYCYFNTGDYENAAYKFADYIKKYPTNKRLSDAKLRLADSYFGSKNFSAASKVYQELFSSDVKLSTDPYARYQYAQALYKSGKTNDAISEFTLIQQNFPTSEYAEVSLYTIGWIYFQKKEYAQSIAQYNIVISKYPKTKLEPIIYYSIGDAQFNMEKYDSAIVNYEKVLAQFPNSEYVFDAVTGIQYSYVARGNSERAVSFLGEFVSKNPGLSYADQLLFKKGEIYYSLRQYDKAKAEYKSFTSAYPNSKLVADSYYWIGKCAQNLKQDDEAIFNYEKVLNGYKDSDLASAVILEMGTIYRSAKNYDAAINTFNRGINELKKSPKVPEFQYNKGMTLLEKNNFQEAYSIFEDVVVYYPGTVFGDKSKFELALIDIAAKRFANADEYLTALSENRSDELGAKSQFYLGQSLYDQGKYKEAITSLVRVRTVYSRYEEWLMRSYLLLGDSYVKLNDKRNAAEMYRAVVTKYSGTPIGDEALQKLRKVQ